MGKECCKDNVFLLNNLVASVALLPSTWGPWEFSVGFGIIADYKLCDQHKVVIHVLFSKITLTDEPPLLWFLKQNCNHHDTKLMLGCKQTTLQSHDFNVTNTKNFYTLQYTHFIMNWLIYKLDYFSTDAQL